MSEAITREEKLLTAIATGETPDIKPITRKEKYLRYLAGVGEKPKKPITREEMFLDKIQAGGTGGGGTGSGDTGSQLDALIDNSITEITSNVTSVGAYKFYSCESLTTVNFPFATDIGYWSFKLCAALTTVYFPMATIVGTSTFYGCIKLTTIDFPCVTRICKEAFRGCGLLTAVILRSETTCSLDDTTAFKSCNHIHGASHATFNPNSLKDGYIYVPRALVDSYKSATNWSDFSTQFRALEDYTVDGTITGELDSTKI